MTITTASTIDPVCGIRVDPNKSALYEDYRGHTYYFCSASCLTKFKVLHSILLVDPDPELRESRRSLLSSIHLPTCAVSCSSEVFGMENEASYDLVAISMSAGANDVSYIAAYVRRRWPDAKILLLGDSCGDVDDPLYDEIVDPSFNPSGFTDVSRRLIGLAVDLGPSAQRLR